MYFGRRAYRKWADTKMCAVGREENMGILAYPQVLSAFMAVN